MDARAKAGKEKPKPAALIPLDGRTPHAGQSISRVGADPRRALASLCGSKGKMKLMATLKHFAPWKVDGDTAGPLPPASVLVYGLPVNTKQHDIGNLFAKYGPVASISIRPHASVGLSVIAAFERRRGIASGASFLAAVVSFGGIGASLFDAVNAATNSARVENGAHIGGHVVGVVVVDPALIPEPGEYEESLSRGRESPRPQGQNGFMAENPSSRFPPSWAEADEDNFPSLQPGPSSSSSSSTAGLARAYPDSRTDSRSRVDSLAYESGILPDGRSNSLDTHDPVYSSRASDSRYADSRIESRGLLSDFRTSDSGRLGGSKPTDFLYVSDGAHSEYNESSRLDTRGLDSRYGETGRPSAYSSIDTRLDARAGVSSVNGMLDAPRFDSRGLDAGANYSRFAEPRSLSDGRTSIPEYSRPPETRYADSRGTDVRLGEARYLDSRVDVRTGEPPRSAIDGGRESYRLDSRVSVELESVKYGPPGLLDSFSRYSEIRPVETPRDSLRFGDRDARILESVRDSRSSDPRMSLDSRTQSELTRSESQQSVQPQSIRDSSYKPLPFPIPLHSSLPAKPSLSRSEELKTVS
ncbi:hypothetical protein BC830DRAFT_511267 [Chytriomyces sp. MP71]|nr:hypothetical protein BC830DRAFT_511267 [Chytriomyces sp. MP71]